MLITIEIIGQEIKNQNLISLIGFFYRYEVSENESKMLFFSKSDFQYRKQLLIEFFNFRVVGRLFSSVSPSVFLWLVFWATINTALLLAFI